MRRDDKRTSRPPLSASRLSFQQLVDGLVGEPVRALAVLKKPSSVALYTDSQYVRKGILEWLPRWKARDWRTADKKPVKNVDLWQALEREIERHRIEWHWVKGHAGVPGNERADQLANEAIDEMLEEKRIADSG